VSRLNYHHLYYFWRVAAAGNLTRVAQTLHVSQSALSSQIRQFEENIDTLLFERRGRRLVLTESGRRVQSYAEDIFSRGEELEALLRRGIEPAAQFLHIGMLSTLSRNFMDSFIAPLLTQRRVQFSVRARNLAGLLDGLARHQLDVALTNSAVLSSEAPVWQSQLLARQPVSIVGPAKLRPRSRFPGGYQRFRWVLPSGDSQLRAAFDGFCTLRRYTPDVQAEADDMAMLRLLARDSGALAVLPTVVVQDEISQGTLVEYLQIPNVFEHFYAITVRRSYSPEVLQMLLRRYAPDV